MASTLRRTMFTRPHHSPFTRAFAWAAVTAAALFGTAFALSSPALAQEDAPPDTTTEPGETTDDPTDEPTTTPDEADPSKKSQEDAEESDDVTAQVEPDFGYNKFRVGVQLEDPSEADGLTTLGSEITITETGPDVPGGEFVTTCTTTLEDPSEPTTTFCENLAPDGFPGNDNLYVSFGERSTIRVQQTGVNDGLEIVDGTKIVEPCGDCEDDQGDVLLTDAVPDDDDDDDDGDESDDEESDDEEEGTLPDVGAPEATLLGFGAILLAVGSRLIAGGRSRTRHRGDGAVI